MFPFGGAKLLSGWVAGAVWLFFVAGCGFLVGFPVQWALAELARVLVLGYFAVFHPFGFTRKCRLRTAYLNPHEIDQFTNKPTNPKF